MRSLGVVLAVGSAAAVQLNTALPDDEGININSVHHMTDMSGGINLHAIVDEADVPDTNHYPGENIARERANDEQTNWGMSLSAQARPKHVIHTEASRRMHLNDDLWDTALLQKDEPQDEKEDKKKKEKKDEKDAPVVLKDEEKEDKKEEKKDEKDAPVVLKDEKEEKKEEKKDEKEAPVFLQLPDDDGISMNSMKHMTNSDGVIDLHAIVDEDDEPVTDIFPGENIEREKANDEETNFGLLGEHRAPKKIIYTAARNAARLNDDLW